MKIKKLMEIWPANTVAVDPWLKEEGIYSDLRRKYISSGWIKSIGRGAIVRSGENVGWEGALYPLQKSLGIGIYVGGKTALELQGYGHFVRMRETRIYLYAGSGVRLPKWFEKGEWGVEIIVIRSNTIPDTEGITEKVIDNIPLLMSAPERAFLELLYMVPDKQGFEEAYLIGEGLSGLRPKWMQRLLEKCKSVKTKRLALFFGESLGHEWFKRLNFEKIDLGKGDRSIIKGGRYINKYKITIPGDFEENARY